MPREPDNEQAPHIGSSHWYLHHLDTHIKASRRTYLGQLANTIVKPLHTTPIPPTNNTWSSYDKQLFFAALSRHSRHRPDLIASDVGKSEAEIQWYLDLLETSRETHESKDRAANKRGLKRNEYWREGVAPAAREVSDEWVSKEEQLATEVIAIIEQREREEDKVFQKKRKRKARSDLIREAGIPRDTKPSERKRIIKSWPGIEEMEKRWEAQEWLDSIGVDKLSELDHLISKFWLEDCEQEVTQSTTLPLIESSSDNERSSAGPSSGLHATARGSREERIARDLRNLSAIQAIPKKRRTPEQRQLLSQILNRQQCRERYRTKRLLAKGMTKAEVRAAGGADMIFAKKNHSDLPKEMSENSHETDSSDRRSKLPEVMDCLKSHGLDIFVYDSMSRFLELDGQPNLSITLSTVQGLYTGLLNFLKPLVLNSIVIAEQSAAVQVSQSSDGAKDDDGFAVTSVHVQQALALRCANAFPFQNKTISITDDHGSNEGVAEDGEQRRSPKGTDKAISAAEYGSEYWGNLSRELFPPNGLSWRALTSFHNRHSTALDPNSLSAATATSDSEPESDAEDEEDAMLHDLLHKVDMEHDRLYEDSLWEALNSNDVEYEPDDKNESWNGHNEKRSEVEQEYIGLYRRIREDRRKRKNAAWRRARYPSSQGERHTSEKSRNAISEAFIHDDINEGLEEGSSEVEDEETDPSEEDE
ncbi:hypothetical protein I309_01488 [Cryptococcus deuterogattii LA55]|nr:hypothetical protein I309_01488 [Cryptococcus deuterogattii LA55]KIR93278.1 hypothetical protein I304_02942 [Cryptococcus deuterogattii CBS 10090]